MVVERQRVSYQPPKSVSLVRLLRDAPAENARSEEHGTPEDDCAAARPGSRARRALARARSMPASDGDRGNKQGTVGAGRGPTSVRTRLWFISIKS